MGGDGAREPVIRLPIIYPVYRGTDGIHPRGNWLIISYELASLNRFITYGLEHFPARPALPGRRL
jgi:hypothetical protein